MTSRGRETVLDQPPVDPLDPDVEVNSENKPELPEDQGLLSIDFVSQFHFGSQAFLRMIKRIMRNHNAC